jgi:hypothetical protein
MAMLVSYKFGMRVETRGFASLNVEDTKDHGQSSEKLMVPPPHGDSLVKELNRDGLALSQTPR